MLFIRSVVHRKHFFPLFCSDPYVVINFTIKIKQPASEENANFVWHSLVDLESLDFPNDIIDINKTENELQRILTQGKSK